MNIKKQLKDKTQKEKANIKSVELAKVKIEEKFIKDGIEIEIIGDIKKIDGGIQVFAKAWKDGKQLGFGKDGSVEIERFKFYNPPVLIDDENGDIIREYIDEETKETIQRKLKYDPDEIIKRILKQTILQVGKDGKNIVEGKVGNTTSIFYSELGQGKVQVYSGSNDWDTEHDRATGDAANMTSAYPLTGKRSDGKFWIVRMFNPFDTSALPDDDEISTATINIYGKATEAIGDDDAQAYAQVIGPATRNSKSAMITADYNQAGAVDSPTVYSNKIFHVDSSQVGTKWDETDYNVFTLNQDGIDEILKDGVSDFAIREGHDIEDSAYAGSDNTKNAYENYI